MKKKDQLREKATTAAALAAMALLSAIFVLAMATYTLTNTTDVAILATVVLGSAAFIATAMIAVSHAAEFALLYIEEVVHPTEEPPKEGTQG